MTITVTEDIIRGNTFALTSNGPTATRMFIAQCSAGETIVEATGDTSIPNYFDEYPLTGDSSSGYVSIYALNIESTTLDEQNNIYQIVVTYGLPDVSQQSPSEDPSDAVINVGSSVTQGETQVDKDGNQLVITLSGKPDQTGTMQVQIPQLVFEFQRRESESPYSKALDNVGRVNSGTVGSMAARTLICLGIDGSSTDNGITWVVTYRFQYNPQTWDGFAVYIDPETGMVDTDVVIATSTGVLTAQLYDTASFTDLGLPW